MKKLEELKKLLVVVDMVNGFIKEGNMADPYINHITEGIVDLVEKYIKEDELVVFIKDTHNENSLEFKKYPVHCMKGSGEERLIPELEKYEDYGLSYEKNSTCALFNPFFLNAINKMDSLEEIGITGCCTDICILNLAIPLVNFFDQNNRDIDVVVYKELVETYDSSLHNREEYNEMSLKLMKQSGIIIK